MPLSEIMLCLWASMVVQMAKNLLKCRRPRLDPWVKKIPWKRDWLPTPVVLPGEFHGQRSLVFHSLWSCKESDVAERLIVTYIIALRGTFEATPTASYLHALTTLLFPSGWVLFHKAASEWGMGALHNTWAICALTSQPPAQAVAIGQIR